ncbi:MAG: 50S ribosomal protein L22 [Candidatus Dependentiae bacterium]|nr:50S ribosomal protein L22 [Candidatus Dependentiae bacterium]
MQEEKKYVAIARYIRISPYKLRPIADVIRGKNVQYALNWLATCALKKVEPIHKVLKSAAANALQLGKVEAAQLTVKEIRIDQGPIIRYFKPGAMGRANIQRKRLSHMSVIVEPVANKKEA